MRSLQYSVKVPVQGEKAKSGISIQKKGHLPLPVVSRKALQKSGCKDQLLRVSSFPGQVNSMVKRREVGLPWLHSG